MLGIDDYLYTEFDLRIKAVFVNIRHLTFRLLQVYVAVVRHGSISEAARQLHLTQPTVSQQLKRLSEAIGSPLLEHHAQGLTMTATGQALYQASRDVLGRFDDFADQPEKRDHGATARRAPAAPRARLGIAHAAGKLVTGAWPDHAQDPANGQ
ncbi:LysR family transcriptional regulator [Halomonas sp. KM072]